MTAVYVKINLCEISEVSKVVYFHRTESMEGKKEMFYLTTHSTNFIYGYMASDIGKGPLS